MLCENCGENEANVKYTQIINGVKKQMLLCDKCSKELGISHMDFNMPINLSSFLGEIFGDNENVSLPGFVDKNSLTCDECGMTYDEFINTGKFGCANCYDAFSSKIDSILKNLQGANTHIGRKTRVTKNVLNKEEVIKSEKEDTKKSKLDTLKDDLKKAIAEERYEDAANIRDEIKKLEK
jgi:protein arginine kinase activator